MKKLILAILLGCTLSACGIAGVGGYDVAHLYSKDGMDAYNDYMSNFINDIKVKANSKENQDLRKIKEVEKTNRLFGKKSFFNFFEEEK